MLLLLPVAAAAGLTLLLPVLVISQYHNRLCDYLNTYDKAFVVHADNVGSKQMSDIRAVSTNCISIRLTSLAHAPSWHKQGIQAAAGAAAASHLAG